MALDHFDILCSLEDRVVSGYVGLRKPHRDIYDYALKQFGIDASGALFVDDKAMNIVGANEAGIRGVRFKDARALRHPADRRGRGDSPRYMKNNDIRRLDRRLCLRSLCGIDAYGRMH